MTIHKAAKTLYPWAAVCALLLLIWKAPLASQAARQGLELCLRTVIPSIFPFLVLTRIFLSSGAGDACVKVLGPLMRPLFRLPSAAASALFLGTMSGYPIGASAAVSLYEDGALTREEAEQLLGFCSNAGPAFFFGMMAGVFESLRAAAVLYGIHVISAVITGILLQAGVKGEKRREVFHRSVGGAPVHVADAVKTMAVICAYVILFRVIGAFLGMIPVLSSMPALSLGLQGILEMAGGCCALKNVEAAGLRYCLASLFPAFGGICVYMQTRAVIAPAGLTGKYYLFGKVVQATAAVLLTWAAMVLFPDLLPRELPVFSSPSHEGLLRSTGIVTAVCLVLLGIWCIYLRKKAGKAEANIV